MGPAALLGIRRIRVDERSGSPRSSRRRSPRRCAALSGGRSGRSRSNASTTSPVCDVDDVDRGLIRVVLVVGRDTQRRPRPRDHVHHGRYCLVVVVRVDETARARHDTPERGANPGIVRPSPERLRREQRGRLPVVVEQRERTSPRAPRRARSLRRAPPRRPAPRRVRLRRSPRPAARPHPRPPTAAAGCSACRGRRARRVRGIRPCRARRMPSRSARSSSVRSGSDPSHPLGRRVEPRTAQESVVAFVRSASHVSAAMVESTHEASALGILLEPAVEPRPRRRDGLVSDHDRVAVGRHQPCADQRVDEVASRRIGEQRRGGHSAPQRRAIRAALDEPKQKRSAELLRRRVE